MHHLSYPLQHKNRAKSQISPISFTGTSQICHLCPPPGGNNTSVCPPRTVGGPAVGVGEQQGAAGAALRGLQVEVPENEDEGGVGGGTKLPATLCVVGVGARVVPGAQRPAARRQHRVAAAVPCGEIKRGGQGVKPQWAPPQASRIPKSPKNRESCARQGPVPRFPQVSPSTISSLGMPRWYPRPPPPSKNVFLFGKNHFSGHIKSSNPPRGPVPGSQQPQFPP